MPLKKKSRTKKKLARKKTVKRAVRRRPLKRKPARKKAITPKKVKKAKENILGTVTHYFPKVMAAVIKMKGPLTTGDRIKIKGHTTDFTQTVSSMQIDHVPIDSAKKGQEIGLLVDSRVRQRDLVYKA